MDNNLINSNIADINQVNIENVDLTTKYLMENIDKTFIMFCNPISGNQEGKIFLSIGNHYLTKEKYRLIDFQYLKTEKKYEPIKIVFFELVNKEDYAKGQLMLKHLSERCKLNKNMGLDIKFQKIKTLIGGGDGSTLLTIENFAKYGIDFEYCIFGNVPLGTGNDLAKTLGFSDHIDISENNIGKLYKLLYKYYNAKFGRIDVWRIDLQMDSVDGQVLYNSEDGKSALKDVNGNIIRRYIRSFINYISLGYDARVGYNFDKSRTDSRFRNKCIYFIEGLKKICCKKTMGVQKFLDTLIVYEDSDNSVNQGSFFSDNNNDNSEFNINPNDIRLTTTTSNGLNLKESNVGFSNKNLNLNKEKKKYEFRSVKSFKENNIKEKCLVLEGTPCSIIFQNIVSYMSGVEHMWGEGKNRLTVKVENGTKEEKEKYTRKLCEMAISEQKFDDKMLEVFTFDNGVETGLEKVYRGLAKKIYHGRGPLEVKFFDTPKYNKEDTKNRIYLNIDGEYFHIVKPKILRIELNKDYCGGQLHFLVGDYQ